MFNVLFLGSRNSARSIMAEAILRRFGPPRFFPFSAGIQPALEVHPLALEILRSNNLPTDGLRSKGSDEFRAPTAPLMDFIISVCERPPDEDGPGWPSGPTRAHWHIADPTLVKGELREQERAFLRAFRELETRIMLFVLAHHENLRRVEERPVLQV